jgi:iron-sulfur cluster repair protein YtfE (RIC family)
VTLCPQLRRLQAEHGRWLAGMGRRAGETEGGHAARVLALWDADILRHCRVEEEVLLPELAGRLSETDAVVLFTLADHVALRRLVRELRCATGSERSAALDALGRRLTEHLAFEERTLLPAVQESLGCDRLAALAVELTSSSTTATTRGRKP